MNTYKYMPDDWQDCGILGENPIEIFATIDTRGGCPETRASVQIWNVTAILEIYGPIRVDITKRIMTSKSDLLYWEERVLKDYLETRRFAEESA